MVFTTMWIKNYSPRGSVLFAANVLRLPRTCSRCEYLRHMGSIEGAYIGIARYAMAHWGDLTWFPLWYGGVPYQNTYPPLLHWCVALVAWMRGITPAHAYHWTTALAYCLGPVTLFALVRRLERIAMGGVRRGNDLHGAFSFGVADCRRGAGSGRPVSSATAASAGGLWRGTACVGDDAVAAGDSVAGSGDGRSDGHIMCWLPRWAGGGRPDELAGGVRAGAGRSWLTCWRAPVRIIGATSCCLRADRRGGLLPGDALGASIDHRGDAIERADDWGRFHDLYQALPRWIAAIAVRAGAAEAGVPKTECRAAVRHFLHISDRASHAEPGMVSHCDCAAAGALSPGNGNGAWRCWLALVVYEIFKRAPRMALMGAMALLAILLVQPLRLDRRYARSIIGAIDITKTSPSGRRPTG